MIRKRVSRRLVLLAGLIAAGAVAAPLYAVSSEKTIKKAEATLMNAAGGVVGNVELREKHGIVEVSGNFAGLSAGFHGFHVHSVGVCTAPAFTSAGGHLNPGATSHRNHAGDMPVLLVNTDGSGEATFTTDRFGVDDLFDLDGSAIIVHANPDNFANIPTDRYDPDPDAMTLGTGDAGGRFACGAVETDKGHD